MEFWLNVLQVLFSTPDSTLIVLFFIFVIIPSAIYTFLAYQPKDPLGFLSKGLLGFVALFLGLFSPLSILIFFFYKWIYKKIVLRSRIRKSAYALTNCISEKLKIAESERENLKSYILLFMDAISQSNTLAVNDIDNLIDWLYHSGFIIPSYDQYHSLGINIATTQKIFVPATVQLEFEDWKSFCKNALDVGILLTSSKNAPSIELWNAELSNLLPGIFSLEPEYSLPVSVLERIIQIAEEAHDERSNLPEYIAQLAGLEHLREQDILSKIDSDIEILIRRHALTLKIPAEPIPKDTRGNIARIFKRADRWHIVHGHRVNQLVNDDLLYMKQHLIRNQAFERNKS